MDRNGQVSQFSWRLYHVQSGAFWPLGEYVPGLRVWQTGCSCCWQKSGIVAASSCCFYDLMPRTPHNFNYTANPNGLHVYMANTVRRYRAGPPPRPPRRAAAVSGVRPSTAARCQIWQASAGPLQSRIIYAPQSGKVRSRGCRPSLLAHSTWPTLWFLAPTSS